MKSVIYTILLSTAICYIAAQIHYVPAQILIPTLNASKFNYSFYNNTQLNGGGRGGASGGRGYGWNVNNNWNIPTVNASRFNNSIYNYTKPNGGGRGGARRSYGWNVNNNWNNSWNNNSYGNGSTPDGHLMLGNIGYYDRLLFNQVYFKERRWWTNRESTIEYPKDIPGGYVRHETIGAIRVYNQFYDGHDSRVKILNGGVGKKFVKIQIKSNYGKGFRYLVQIFGH